jgi:hypothetical protein
MKGGIPKSGFLISFLVLFFYSSALLAQQTITPSDVPSKFKLDIESAARLRPRLIAHSTTAAGKYEAGRSTLQNLLRQLHPPTAVNLSWELRITDTDLLSAYSSPDGTIYVDRNLAQLAGDSAGLWAAILSHEVEHIVRRDWARRYLYEHSREAGRAGNVILGEAGAVSDTWTDERTASADIAAFCRQLEIEADREALGLMARAGYHPDFVPALHHLMHVLGKSEINASPYAMHPDWELRDREFENDRPAAGILFERLWPDWNISPGGNPPVVVFADAPKIMKTGAQQWALEVPIICRNLVGAVEVVLVTHPPETQAARSLQQLSAAPEDRRQLTGCTSPRTTITFDVAGDRRLIKTESVSVDVFVLDSWGSVLSRAYVPRLR